MEMRDRTVDPFPLRCLHKKKLMHLAPDNNNIALKLQAPNQRYDVTFSYIH